jgi:alkylated DNA repair protein (DNA oxidative demethylase)
VERVKAVDWEPTNTRVQREALGPGATVLRRFALAEEMSLLTELECVVARAPFRHMVTPAGFTMQVAMTNCGSLGWVTDRSAYRYDPIDPASRQPWPPIPAVFMRLAIGAAAEAGFGSYDPDVRLINRYEPGTKLSLHQDKDEQAITHT